MGYGATGWGWKGLLERKGRPKLLTCASWVLGTVKVYISGRENGGSERGGAFPQSPPARGQRLGAGKPVKVPGAGQPADRGAKAGPDKLTMAGGAVPSRQRVVALQPDPGWAITWGRGRELRRWRLQNWLRAA